MNIQTHIPGVSGKQNWLSLELPPWQSLRDYVQKITIHEGSQPGSAPSEILPRPNMVIGFQYGELLKIARSGDQQTLYESGVTGLQTSVRYALPAQLSRFVLVHLRPWGGTAFLPGSMAALRDLHIDLGSALDRAEVAETQERIEQSPNHQARLAIAGAFLQRNLHSCRVDPSVRAAVALLEQTSGNITVAALARRLFTSQRQLERRFGYHVGISPKQFALLLRVGKSLRLLQEGLPAAEIALACGYFDQAHFAHAFERFTGRGAKRFISQGASLFPA
jgi:AraC-like DNA-binding protein